MRALFFLALFAFASPAAAAPKGRTRSPAAAKPVAKPAAEPVAEPAAEPVPAPAPAPAPPKVEAPAPASPPPAVAPLPTTGKPRLIVLGLTASGGVDPGVADSLTETLAAEVSRTGLFEVTSQKDIATLLGVERQKQLLGCGEEATACLAELAGAAGARFILSGSVARLGDAFQLNLQTQDSVKVQTLGRATRIASDLKALRGQLPYAIAEATATPPPVPPSKVLPTVLLVSGAATVTGAGVIFLQSFFREQAALSELSLAKTQPQLQLKPASYYRDEAAGVSQLRLVGAVVAGAGAALLVAGIVVYPRDDRAVQLALFPTSNGVVLVGSWR